MSARGVPARASCCPGLPRLSKRCNAWPRPELFRCPINPSNTTASSATSTRSRWSSIDWIHRLVLRSAIRFTQRVRRPARRQKGRAFPDRARSAAPSARKQLYWPDTNVLLTRFHCDEGVGEITDFMPIEIFRTQSPRSGAARHRCSRIGQLQTELPPRVQLRSRQAHRSGGARWRRLRLRRR